MTATRFRRLRSGSTAGTRSCSGPVSRVPTLPVHEVSKGRREPEDAADPFQDVRRPRLPELAERLDVDPGIGQGPEGRHEAKGHPEDDEKDPRGAKGAGSFR